MPPPRALTDRAQPTAAAKAPACRVDAGCSTPSRIDGHGTPGAIRASRITAMPPARNSASVNPAATQKYKREAPVGRRGHRQSDQRERPAPAFTAISSGDGRVALRHQPIAKQRPARNARRSAQRPKRKAQRDEQPIGSGQPQRSRDRSRAPAAPAGSTRQEAPRPTALTAPAMTPSDDPGRRQRQHLDQAHSEHQTEPTPPGSAAWRSSAPAHRARHARHWPRRCRRPAATSGRPASETAPSGR